MSVGADAPGGDTFEVQLTSYRQIVLSDHKIQTLHAMQVYVDAPGQEETAEGIDQQTQDCRCLYRTCQNAVGIFVTGFFVTGMHHI